MVWGASLPGPGPGPGLDGAPMSIIRGRGGEITLISHGRG